MQPVRPIHRASPARRPLTVALAVALALVLAPLAACRPVQVQGGAGSPAPTAPPAAGSGTGTPDRPGAPRTRPPHPTASSAAPAEPAALMAKGAESAQVRELQARLRQLSYFDRSPTGYYGDVTAAAVTAFQRARGLPRTGRTDTATWHRLVAMTHPPAHDELYPPTTLPVSKPDPRCMTGRALCISKQSRTLSWMVGGHTLAAMDVRFGSEYTPTREGAFTVYWKSRHHVSTIYHTAMPYAMFFSGGQAVHYSADFAARGYGGASHGCVNVRNEKKIANLYSQVRTGDKVIIY
jgi:peptidoglycan hydrolase-like protein with peptidoglycan-binding domain